MDRKGMEKLDTLIQNKNDLQKLIQLAKQTDAIALDTEFVWERTYFPQLGLIQIALSNEDCYLVDPCAIDDLSPLGQLLADRSIVKILHDAPQDLVILHRATGAVPQNIFDTRLAAGFSNLPATLSLCNLARELLDITLSKTETRTNWMQRPLSSEQIAYALNDVRYLRAIRVILLSRIIGPKIKAWLQEELNLLNNPATYSGPSIDRRFRKIRGAGSLDRQGLAILKNMTIWREGMARKINRPRGHVVKDSILLELAKKRPRTIESLRETAVLSARAFKKYGKFIAAIVDESCNQNPSSYPPVKRSIRLSAKQKKSYEKLNNLIALKCDLLGIAPSLVGTGSELKQVVKMLRSGDNSGNGQLRQTVGWRKTLLDDFFKQSIA
jgi:ribonuclease D